MKNKFNGLFLLLMLVTTSCVLSKISISGDSLEELHESIAQFQSIANKNITGVVREPELGVLDKQIKKVEDKFCDVYKVINANKRSLKWGSILSVFVYSKFINASFLPSLISTGATTAMKYLSLFIDALFKGALQGVWENKGMTGKIVGGMILYAVVNNVMSIGIRSVSEYWIAGHKAKAKLQMENKYKKQ